MDFGYIIVGILVLGGIFLAIWATRETLKPPSNRKRLQQRQRRNRK